MMLQMKDIILEKVSGQRRAANDVLADRTYRDHPHLQVVAVSQQLIYVKSHVHQPLLLPLLETDRDILQSPPWL